MADEKDNAVELLVVAITEHAVMALDADEDNTLQIEAFGKAVEQEIIAALNTRPSPQPAEKMELVEELRDPETLADLRNCNRGQTAALLERAAEALNTRTPIADDVRDIVATAILNASRNHNGLTNLGNISAVLSRAQAYNAADAVLEALGQSAPSSAALETPNPEKWQMDDFETFDKGTGDKLRQIAKTLRDHPLEAHELKLLADRLDGIAKGR